MFDFQLVTVYLYIFAVAAVIVFVALHFFQTCYCCYCRRHHVCSTYSLHLLMPIWDVVVVVAIAFTIIVIVVLGLFLIRLRDFVIVAAQSLFAGINRCIICNMQYSHYKPVTTATTLITRAQLLHPLEVFKLDFDKAAVVRSLVKLSWAAAPSLRTLARCCNFMR